VNFFLFAQPRRFLGSMDRSVDQINLQTQPPAVVPAPNTPLSPGQQPVKRKRGRPPKRKKEDDGHALAAPSMDTNSLVYATPNPPANPSMAPLGTMNEFVPSSAAAPNASPQKSARYETKSGVARPMASPAPTLLSPGPQQSHSGSQDATSKTPVQKRVKKPSSSIKKRIKQVC
jgi:hypothetical protein